MPSGSESDHPQGERDELVGELGLAPAQVDPFTGSVHVEWDPKAAMTPLGQLAFFMQFLKLGGRFDPWVEQCPLYDTSNNAPQKVDVLSSVFLSIWSGHKRYAPMICLINDQVNCNLLGMSKVVSDDSARRALPRLDEAGGIGWLHHHLYAGYEPLLTTPWIMDVT